LPEGACACLGSPADSRAWVARRNGTRICVCLVRLSELSDPPPERLVDVAPSPPPANTNCCSCCKSAVCRQPRGTCDMSGGISGLQCPLGCLSGELRLLSEHKLAASDAGVHAATGACASSWLLLGQKPGGVGAVSDSAQADSGPGVLSDAMHTSAAACCASPASSTEALAATAPEGGTLYVPGLRPASLACRPEDAAGARDWCWGEGKHSSVLSHLVALTAVALAAPVHCFGCANCVCVAAATSSVHSCRLGRGTGLTAVALRELGLLSVVDASGAGGCSAGLGASSAMSKFSSCMVQLVVSAPHIASCKIAMQTLHARCACSEWLQAVVLVGAGATHLPEACCIPPLLGCCLCPSSSSSFDLLL
jgi:hypothetical protein